MITGLHVQINLENGEREVKKNLLKKIQDCCENLNAF